MRAILAGLLLFVSLLPAARANVAYIWHADSGAAPYKLQLKLVFTDQAVRDGVVQLHANGYDGDATTYRDAGLVSLFYSFKDNALPIAFFPTTKPLGEGGYLDIDLHFLGEGSFTGSIAATNMNADIALQGDGPAFAVTSAHSDQGMTEQGCPWDSPWGCAGATGHFIRAEPDSDRHDVPEPGSLALFTLGLAALCRPRRATGRPADAA